MEPCDFSIEFAHLYYDDVLARNFSQLRPAIDVVQSVLRMLRERGAVWSLSILIDDYGLRECSRDASALREFLAEAGLEVHHIAYEADLALVAENLLQSLRSRSVRETEDGVTFRSENSDPHFGEFDIPELRPKSLLLGSKPSLTVFRQKRVRARSEVVIASENPGVARRYGCAFLASCWVLARMGVSPYLGALQLDSLPNSPPFVGKQIINILPTRYLKVEATVMEMLGEIRNQRIRKMSSRVQYIFHRTEE